MKYRVGSCDVDTILIRDRNVALWIDRIKGKVRGVKWRHRSYARTFRARRIPADIGSIFHRPSCAFGCDAGRQFGGGQGDLLADDGILGRWSSAIICTDKAVLSPRDTVAEDGPRFIRRHTTGWTVINRNLRGADDIVGFGHHGGVDLCIADDIYIGKR